jgi:Fibronectin type III domain
MQRLGFPLIRLIVFGGMTLRLSALASASNLPEQNILSPASLRASAATHETRAGSQARLQEVIEFPSANKVTRRIETVAWTPPTRSSFMATWSSVSGAKGYLLDVSVSNSFSSYVDGYHGLDVGNVNGRTVTELNPGTTYYYRVRAYTAAGSGRYSNVTTATTEAPTGLIIIPTFDGSIINDPSSVAIQAMINRAIAIYESLFSDPITIRILFRYSTTAPNGDPLPVDVLSASRSAIYTVSWNNFISHLRADATTSNDNVANASLPGSALSTNIA